MIKEKISQDKSKIDTITMREVLQSVGIFVPYEEYQIMLNAFKLTPKSYLSYQEFLSVFARTHYPQPFVRKTHLEAPEGENESSPKMAGNTSFGKSKGIASSFGATKNNFSSYYSNSSKCLL